MGIMVELRRERAGQRNGSPGLVSYCDGYRWLDAKRVRPGHWSLCFRGRENMENSLSPRQGCNVKVESVYVSVCYRFFFFYVAQDGLMILLLQPPERWGLQANVTTPWFHLG